MNKNKKTKINYIKSECFDKNSVRTIFDLESIELKNYNIRIKIHEVFY